MIKKFHYYLLLSAFLLVQGMMAQTKTVSGTVSDDLGTPLPGVNVVEKGTNNGASTDFDGNFSIKVSNNATLVFSSLGFTKKEIAVGVQTTLNVVLEEDAEQLGEVVVTGLGITREKKALGYATATISAEALTETATPNFATALYGKAPGVSINTTPGGSTSASNITIRGVASITGRSQPLIILDGVPIRDGEVSNNNYWGDQRLRGNGLLDINPEDIDNISILKGASAAALYGSEAVNGVVLITTKSGKNRKNGMTVDLSSSYSFDKVAYLPRYQTVRGPGAPLNVSDGGQDAEGFIYHDVDGNGSAETRGVLGYSINFGPKFDGKPTIGWDGIVRPYEAQDDRYSGLFNTAHNTSVNMSITNVTDNSNLRFSYTRQDNEGISIGAEEKKNIFNLNTTFKWAEDFSTDVIVNYVNQSVFNRPYSVDRLTNNFSGMMSPFDSADWYLDRYKTSKGYRYVQGTGQSLTPEENIIYPGFKDAIGDFIWRVKENRLEEQSNRVIGTITNNWDITTGLNLRGRISNDFTNRRTEASNSTERPLAFGNSGGFSMSNNNYNVLYGELLLRYETPITTDLTLAMMAGYNATKQSESNLNRGTNGGLSVENWFDVAASVNTPNSGSSRESIVKDAFLGTMNLDYKGYFYVEGTIRKDKTSTMNPNNNSFVYPSVNSSFVLSEAFDLPLFMNYFKIRGSWGIVGNYPDIYGANIAYNQNTLGSQGGNPVLYTTIPSSFGNDGIRPEEKHEYEFGMELKFFQGRLGLDVSYYNAQVVDQILPLTLPNSSGASSVLTNIGTLRNKGYEFGLTGTPIDTGSFRWDVIVNLAKNENVVEKLAPGLDELLHADYDGNAAQLKSLVGQPMGDLYAHPVATDAQGRRIVDPNGLYKVDADKMEKFGNAMPKWTGGVMNSFSYKNITLDALVDGRIGGHVMPTALNWMTSRGLTEESTKFMDTESGGLSYYEDVNGTRIQTTPSATAGPGGEVVYHDGILLDGVTNDGQPNDQIASSADYYWTVYNWGGPQYSPNTRYELYIKENTYFKMRELSIGYKMPRKVLDNIGLSKLQFSVFGRNLFYLYRTIKDMDGEQTTAGSRWFQNVNNVGSNPSTRSFGLMVRASL
ncbi:SusC/RagA family TonB-linked outer membrane protein [Arenibacter sp. BSSL-BM3]|uniref:SusC/RagA family TonB-linked outer membrane protein n=1 Tax=Arenibacter arenosicollis TaxID=2762274 RepID=A0ABR7QSP7_9FLAO|nr:SusC/RagA family TonB-linked outer membrane protein [Arenibacter arenosicollis]MBC8770214.1 SusC/RagA family TonB-linked outer membrane protein [Arenibacter arenosicollis]